MRLFSLTMLCTFGCIALYGQKPIKSESTDRSKANPENIYSIKKHFLHEILSNPAEEEGDEDNDLARFNRWFHLAEIRCYPSGNMPRPDALLNARLKAENAAGAHQKQTAATDWQPVGPFNVPSNFNGIGRVNCIVISPNDTNTLYIGTACGGVWISHDGGGHWTSNTDNFPSLSIADIAVNPHNTDTIYAATGDGYGYENGSFNAFWGGLYSAGVMKSNDGGATWNPTGLSYLQTNRDIIQRLLIHPNKTNVLLAATRNGILRTTDGGATWTNVEPGHVYSMALHPTNPDTVYAVNTNSLRVSYNAGATWQTLSPGINPTADRCTIAVSPVAPDAIWILDGNEDLRWSHNGGLTFTTTTSPNTVANFYGYYDRVLAVSPVDSDYVLAYGMKMAKTDDGGITWSELDPLTKVHVDNHAAAINRLHPATIYTGNDGGIAVTRNGGASWTNLGNGLMISQIYQMGTSQQNADIVVCGLQDNGSFTYNGTNWLEKTGGDGMDCAIHPTNDMLQISSYQYGNFFMSYDQGGTFSPLHVSTETGYWVSPVVFDHNSDQIAYFGLKNIYATYDQGFTFTNITSAIPTPFTNGSTSLAIAPSNSQVLYASSFNKLIRTTDGGTTWTTAVGTGTTALPVSSNAISFIAVDPHNAMRVFVTISGYAATKKVYMSTNGGTNWTNITGTGLPNLPANCIALDTTTPGATFVGTDMGVYYIDSSQTSWTLYHAGLPNVIVDDINISYSNYKVRAATFGRGVWECKLKKDLPPQSVAPVVTVTPSAGVYPNPTTSSWKLRFPGQKPASYSVKVLDAAGRTVRTEDSPEAIDASALAAGLYTIEVVTGDKHYNIKGIRK